MKKFLKGIATTLLVILLFVSALIILEIAPLRRTISNHVIKDMISSLEIEKEIQENPQFKEELDETLEPIYDVTREFGIEDEVVLKVLDSDEVKGLIGNISSNIVQSLLTGENGKLITAGDIDSVLSGAIDEVNASGVYNIDEEAKKEIINITNEKVDELEELIPDTSEILNEVNEEDMKLIEGVRFILSNKFLIYNAVVFLVSLVGILLLNWKNFKWLKISLITILVATIISALITSVVLCLNNVIIQEEFISMFNIVGRFIKISYIISGSTFICSIILLIVCHILRKKNIS